MGKNLINLVLAVPHHFPGWGGSFGGGGGTPPTFSFSLSFFRVLAFALAVCDVVEAWS